MRGGGGWRAEERRRRGRSEGGEDTGKQREREGGERYSCTVVSFIVNNRRSVYVSIDSTQKYILVHSNCKTERSSASCLPSQTLPVGIWSHPSCHSKTTYFNTFKQPINVPVGIWSHPSSASHVPAPLPAPPLIVYSRHPSFIHSFIHSYTCVVCKGRKVEQC